MKFLYAYALMTAGVALAMPQLVGTPGATPARSVPPAPAPAPALAKRQQTFTVKVLRENVLHFDPQLVPAEVGDIISFQLSGFHTVTESSFEKPCEKAEGGIDKGESFDIVVQDKNPRWFHCKTIFQAKSHCHSGMVFAINPSAEQSFEKFRSNALKSETTPPGGSVTGYAPTQPPVV